MSIIVKDGKFYLKDPAVLNFSKPDEYKSTASGAGGIDLPSDTDPRDVIERVGNIPAIRITFPTSADGRGLSIAKALRRAGYQGHLRACGHILADQYPLALLSGFDDVEISNQLAARQPEEQWIDALARTKTGYHERLMKPANFAADSTA